MQIKYSREDTLKAKAIIGKYDKIGCVFRNNFSPMNRVGNLTDLFRLHKPKSEEDFFNKYITYAEAHKNTLPVIKRGLTNDELLERATTYMSLANNSANTRFELDLYIKDMLCHLITETYDGKKYEMQFFNYLTSCGYEPEFVCGELDSEYGVDILIDKNEKSLAIQVKPISFFKSTRSDVCQDKAKLIRNNYKLLQKRGIKTVYAIYHKDKKTNEVKWVVNKKGKFKFCLDELFSYDIKNIEGTLKVKEGNWQVREI